MSFVDKKDAPQKSLCCNGSRPVGMPFAKTAIEFTEPNYSMILYRYKGKIESE